MGENCGEVAAKRRKGLNQQQTHMPITYVIDVANWIVFSTAKGVVDLDTFKSYLLARNNDPEFDLEMNGLFDAGDASFNLTPGDLRLMADITKRQLPRAGVRRAIVAAGDLGYGLSRMFEVLATNGEIESGVFRNYDEALAWVKGGKRQSDSVKHNVSRSGLEPGSGPPGDL